MRFSRGPAVLSAVFALALGCGSRSVATEQQKPKAAPSVDLFGGFEPAGRVSPVEKARAEASAAAHPIQEIAPTTGHDAVSNDGAPKLAATRLATLIYRNPNTESSRLGYIRLGGVVERAATPVAGHGCKGQWYAVRPAGFVCTEDATIDLSDLLVRAASRRPELNSPLPYRYGFVRATAPEYLRIPTHKEQLQSEIELDDHLKWYQENEQSVQRVTLGANDIPLDDHGVAVLDLGLRSGQHLSTMLDGTELLGGTAGSGTVPFWLADGRSIPNVSGFDVPKYAVFADRVRRKTGLSFVDAFMAQSEGVERRFGVTVDLRLIPATKVKPDTGSPFHGMALDASTKLPFAFVLKGDTPTFRLIRGHDEARPDEAVPRRAIIPLTGKARVKAGSRFYQVLRDQKRWLRASDIGVVELPPTWPEAAEKGEKWIDVSLVQQTLVLYQGKKPVYATLVSTGQDRLGDPKTQKATLQGTFRIQSKHIAATMDSNENTTLAGGQKTEQHLAVDDEARETIERLTKAEAAHAKLDEDDKRRLANIHKGRHPEYGVTHRRGSASFELRDVPWIQYFAAGFALHGAYWHDVFGIPRSHGCINLSPIDAHYLFFWTDPPLPEGWHGFNADPPLGQGTTVVVRP